MSQGKCFQDREFVFVVAGDLRVFGVVHEFVAGVDVGAADDDDVVGFAAFVVGTFIVHVVQPLVWPAVLCATRTALPSFTSSPSCRTRSTFVGGYQVTWIVAVAKIFFAAGFDDGNVGVHHHVFRAGHLDDFGAAGAVVPVRVADEEDFCVAEFEAEFFDAGLNQRHALFEAAVDEDVSVGRGDEIRRQAFAADVVEIAHHAMRRKWIDPVGRRAGIRRRRLRCGACRLAGGRAVELRATRARWKRFRQR